MRLTTCWRCFLCHFTPDLQQLSENTHRTTTLLAWRLGKVISRLATRELLFSSHGLVHHPIHPIHPIMEIFGPWRFGFLRKPVEIEVQIRLTSAALVD